MKRRSPPIPVRAGDWYLIPLTKNLYAKVDAIDVDRVSQFIWSASLESRGTKYYAVRWVSKRTPDGSMKRVKIRLHHFVLEITPEDLPEGFVVDHDDHDGLNCTRGNLQIITQVENMEKSRGWKKKGVPVEPFL